MARRHRGEDHNEEVYDFTSNDGVDYLSHLTEHNNTQEDAGDADDDQPSGRYSSRGKGRRSTAKQETQYYDEQGMAYGAQSVSVREAKGAVIPKGKVATHQLLCLQMYKFMSHPKFGPAIRDAGIKVNDLDKKTVSELEALVQRCRVTAMGAGTQGGAIHYIAQFGCQGIEATVNKSGKADLTGFANRVNADPEAQNLIDLLAIDYGMQMNIPLPAQVAMCLGKIAVTTAGENKIKAEMQSGAARLQQEMLQKKAQQQQQQQIQQPQIQQPLIQMQPLVPMNNIASPPAAAAPLTGRLSQEPAISSNPRFTGNLASGIHQSTRPVYTS
jgi:hypothetical protein